MTVLRSALAEKPSIMRRDVRDRETGDHRIGHAEEPTDFAAAATLAHLIENITIYPGGPEAEIVSRVEDLMEYAANENSRPGVIRGGCSMAVVAGVGFEPTTFRL